MSIPDGTHRVDLTSSTIFRTLIILVGFWFLYVIIDLLVMLFAAIVISSAIKPVADKLQQYRIPRGVSVLVVYLIVLLIFSGVVTLMIPPLTEQTSQLAQALPSIVERLNLQSFLPVESSQDLVVPLQRAMLGVGDNVANLGANLFARTRTIFSGAFTLVFVFVIALYMVVDRDALKKPFRLFGSAEHAAYAEGVIDRAQRNIGRWVLAQMSLGLIIGLSVWLGLWLMGMKYWLVLGLIAGAFEVVPVIGPITAAVPAVLLGFSQSALMGLGVLVFYVILQQAENHLLIPAIMKKATGLNPLIVILAVLLGVRLAGVVGVILAVPAAVVISAFASDFVKKPHRHSDKVEGQGN